MKLSSLSFLVYESFRNIWRNGMMSLAALGTVAVALTILGASLWSAYRIHEIAGVQPQKLNEIDVFLDVKTSREGALDVQERIRALPEVKRAELVTREEAWAETQAGQPSLKEAALDNPLPDAFRVEVSNVRRMSALTSILRDQARFPEVNWINDSNDEVRTLLAFAGLIKALGGAVSVGLFAATLLIVHNTIRLTVFARRREIRIMQLVGATPGFIRFPLLLEGLFYGVTGGAIACGFLLLGQYELAQFIHQVRSPLLGDVPSHLSSLDVLSGLIALGALIGLTGSYLAMRRFLKHM